MYVLAKDIADQGRVIPKGTRLSDIYECPWGGYWALAHIWGQRIRLTLAKADLATEPEQK